MPETTSSNPSTTSNSAAIESYKNLVDDYVKNGLNLSTGAKIGIGVGAGVVGLVIIGMIIFIAIRLRRSRSSKSGEANTEGKGGSETSLTEEQKAAEARRMRALDNM
ncbi:uncharacterized protein DFL_005421 [Arthrobotrys flagrans]|uniref:Uncharacterized protein n=1 Tax=Arthrobotrys flagrans TaxID=97331 RepID=A0A436ZXC3_ARTFL|nr:hypothetical protein DFL_005421 [Arthrobotrys flagrans]